ncbi:MAG: DUF4124 domain-containing protein [Acidiferrobacterales bacterium]
MKAKVLVTVLFFALFSFGQGQAAGIKKCKDDQGRWHYGDRAAESCSQSKVIEMNTSGTKTGEQAAPPTEQERAQLAGKKAETERLKKLQEEQDRKDQLLLATYGLEKDIIYIRDRKISQLENSITASKATLTSLEKTLERQKKTGVDEKQIKRTEAQLATHRAVIKGKREEQAALKKKYAADLERFRIVKRKQAATAVTKPTKKK